MMTVPTEVQTGSEMEAGVAEHLDLEFAHRTISKRGDDAATLQSTIRGVIGELLIHVDDGFDTTVDVLNECARGLLLEAREHGLGNVEEHAVVGSIGTFEQQRTPEELERATIESAARFEISGRCADVVTHTPGMVAG